MDWPSEAAENGSNRDSSEAASEALLGANCSCTLAMVDRIHLGPLEPVE